MHYNVQVGRICLSYGGDSADEQAYIALKAGMMVAHKLSASELTVTSINRLVLEQVRGFSR